MSHTLPIGRWSLESAVYSGHTDLLFPNQTSQGAFVLDQGLERTSTTRRSIRQGALDGSFSRFLGRGEYRRLKLGKTLTIGLTSAATAQEPFAARAQSAITPRERREIRRDTREIRADRREIRRDRRDLRRDRRDFHADKRDLRRDYRDLRADRRERPRDIREATLP